MPDPNPNPSPNPSPNPLPNPSPQAAWHASISADAETLGYLQNRGWDKLDAKTAANMSDRNIVRPGSSLE